MIYKLYYKITSLLERFIHWYAEKQMRREEFPFDRMFHGKSSYGRETIERWVAGEIK